MKRSLLWALAIVPILSHGRIGSVQTGIPCYYDWSQLATPETSATPEPVKWQKTILRSPEFKDIVDRCRRQQSETVRWDDHVRAMEAAVGDFAGPARTGVLGLIEMLRKEREHLRAASAGAGGAGSRALLGDSNVRYFDLGPMMNQRVRQPDRLTVAPEFRSWVPQFLRERVGNIFRTYGRIAHFEGEATIRRGDSTVRVSELLQRGKTWALQPGDVFEVQRGRLVLEYDGKRYELLAGSTAALDLDEQCATLTRHGSGGRQRLSGTPMYLIEGTLLYMTTTTNVRSACVVTTPVAVGFVQGTSFTATHTPTEAGRTFNITVTSGTVTLEDRRTGGTLTLGPGDSRQLMESGPPQAPATTAFQYDWDVQNNCTYAVDFKLFELNSRDEVTGSWKAVSIAAGGRKRIPIRPTPGGKVCWGAATTNGNLRWGIGLDGGGTCERCCSETSVTNAMVTRTANLTCPGK